MWKMEAAYLYNQKEMNILGIHTSSNLEKAQAP